MNEAFLEWLPTRGRVDYKRASELLLRGHMFAKASFSGERRLCRPRICDIDQDGVHDPSAGSTPRPKQRRPRLGLSTIEKAQSNDNSPRTGACATSLLRRCLVDISCRPAFRETLVCFCTPSQSSSRPRSMPEMTWEMGTFPWTRGVLPCSWAAPHRSCSGPPLAPSRFHRLAPCMD